MSRDLTIRCENCGVEAPRDTRPATWWLLEQVLVAQLQTGALDFCTLSCLVAWTTDAQVRANLPADFSADAMAQAAVGAAMTSPKAD